LDPLLGHGLKLISDDVAIHDRALDWTGQPRPLFSVDGPGGHAKGSIDADVQLPFVSADAHLGDDGTQVSVIVGLGDHDNSSGNKDQPTEQVGLVGIFFRCGSRLWFCGVLLICLSSTFFGGHDDRYATPEDQYIWFKDFSLTVNV